jgi:hypothetical protein
MERDPRHMEENLIVCSQRGDTVAFATIVEHYTNGVWSDAKEPAGFYVGWGLAYGFDILSVGSSQEVWIGGTLGRDKNGVEKAAIARDSLGKWSVYN